MDSIGEMSVFAEVVLAGSFVGAAPRFALTASGVSRKISRFEERLGVRLFNRTTRALSLTEAGEALFERCQAILESVDAVESTVRDLGGAPKGTLRVATSDALSVGVIVPFLKTFNQQYPDLSVTLIQADGGIDLLSERVDVAVLFKRPEETSFIARKLIEDPWIFCASPEYLKQYGMPNSPSDLSEHRCLTIHARGLTADHWKFANKDKVETTVVHSSFSGIGLTVKEAALQGMGVARLAYFLVCADIAAGRLVPVLTDHLVRNDRAIFAVYPNRQYLPSKTRLFIDDLSGYIDDALIVPGH
jgi:DNA-binding transcriptional LysR family regulator